MQLALKIDVDTYRGLDEGVPRLARFLKKHNIPATFFVTLGPDRSGMAALRMFKHRGFLKKMNRTSAISLYGWRTVLSGTLLPARPMGTSFGPLLQSVAGDGFEVSPHGFDHIAWHDQAAGWSVSRATQELDRLRSIYRAIFRQEPRSFAAPGWQAGEGTWLALEPLQLLYHSDTRGQRPYFPIVQGKTLKTLEIPTTLPTWDEMLAWENIGPHHLADQTRASFRSDQVNVWTIHAEFEGGFYFPQFEALIQQCRAESAQWVFLPDWANYLRSQNGQVSGCAIEQGTRPGRAGTVTCQVDNGSE